MQTRWNPERFLRVLRRRRLSLVALSRTMGLHDSALYPYFPKRDGTPPDVTPSLDRIFEMCVAAGIVPSSIDSRLSDREPARSVG